MEPKKRGRPLGSKNKIKPDIKPEVKVDGPVINTAFRCRFLPSRPMMTDEKCHLRVINPKRWPKCKGCLGHNKKVVKAPARTKKKKVMDIEYFVVKPEGVK